MQIGDIINSKTLKNGVLTIPKEIMGIDFSENNSLVDKIKNMKVKKIQFEKGSKLFYIGEFAFSNNNTLKEIDFRNCEYLEKIKNYAFAFCKNLDKITFNDNSNIKYIGVECFKNSSLKEFNLCNSKLEFIDAKAFSNCKALQTINLKNNENFKYIGVNAFENVDLKVLDLSGCDKIEFSMPNKIQSKNVKLSSKIKHSSESRFCDVFCDDCKIQLIKNNKTNFSFKADEELAKMQIAKLSKFISVLTLENKNDKYKEL